MTTEETPDPRSVRILRRVLAQAEARAQIPTDWKSRMELVSFALVLAIAVDTFGAEIVRVILSLGLL